MNILYIDHYAGSMRYGMEFRPYYLGSEWIKEGHQVTVIGGDFSHLRPIQPQVKHDFQLETEDGINYLWVKAGTYDGNGVKRALSMFRFVGKLWLNAGRLARELKPDAVISSSTYPLDSYAGVRIAKLAGARYVHEAHDVWPMTLIELGGMSRKHPFVILLNIAEKHAYRKASKVISVLPATLPHMMEQGLGDERKFFYIPNGIVLSDWKNPEPLNLEHNEIFSKLRQQGKTIIGYAGGMTKYDMLDAFLDVAKRFQKDDKLIFVLVGKGVDRERLLHRKAEESIDNVMILPPVPKKQVPEVLHRMDCLYVSFENSPLYRFGVSVNKVYDYMMSGKPILYGVQAANNEVQEAGCGLCFDQNSKDGLYRAIDQFKSMNQKEREDMGKNGKTWVVREREYRVLADKFMRAIERKV